MTEHDEKLKTLAEKVKIDLTKVKRSEPKVSCSRCRVAQKMGTVKYCECMR